MQPKDVVGRWGERTAAAYLVAAGLTVVEQNWRCDLGELDIVARDGSAVVFCEVKTRTSTAFGDPAEAVVGPKAVRLRRLAARYFAEHPEVRGHDSRFDVVSIVRPRVGAATLRHLRGAF